MNWNKPFIDLHGKNARQKLVYGGAGLPPRTGSRRKLGFGLGRKADRDLGKVDDLGRPRAFSD